MRRIADVCVVLTLLAAFALAAHADILHLADGRKIEGKILEETKEFVRIETTFGGVQKIEQSRILRIERKKTPKEEYDGRLRRTDPKDPDALFQLGTWARDNGLVVEALECFRKVIQIDPDHALARKELGFVRKGDQWIRASEADREAPAPTDEADRVPADADASFTFADGFLPRSGFSKFRGEWVTVKEQREIEEGKKRWRGRFVTPEEYAKLEQGLVPDGGAWLPRVQADERHASWDTAREIETLHYRIRTDWPWENADRVADLLERNFREYARVFGGPPKEKMLLYLFRTKEEYEDYLSRNQLGRYLGKDSLFDARSRILYGWSGKNYALVERIIAGDGAWVYYYYAYKNALPSWLSEGIAIYFRRFGFDDAGNYVRARPDRARLLALIEGEATDNLFPLGELLKLEYFAVYDRGQIEYFSAQSWALVNYLLHDADEATHTKFFRFLERLRTTHFVLGNADFLGAQIFEEIFGEDGMRHVATEYLEAAKRLARAEGIVE